MFTETPIKDLLIYEPKVHRDNRGYFFESYNQKHFTEYGLNGNFVQDNRSFSKKGTLRGLHFQKGEHAQAKLVGVLKGEVYDIAVDLRPNSPHFKESYGIYLKENEQKFFYIPRGFAHGFIVLSEEAEFFYKCDNFYNPEADGGIHYADKELNIDWILPKEDYILSDKDLKLQTLEEYLKEL